MGRRTSTKAKLVIALGLMYKEIGDMPDYNKNRESTADAKRDGLRTIRLLLDSPVFMERLAAKMDEVS